MTALQLACDGGYTQIAELLVKAKADLEAKTVVSWTSNVRDYTHYRVHYHAYTCMYMYN